MKCLSKLATVILGAHNLTFLGLPSYEDGLDSLALATRNTNYHISEEEEEEDENEHEDGQQDAPFRHNALSRCDTTTKRQYNSYDSAQDASDMTSTAGTGTNLTATSTSTSSRACAYNKEGDLQSSSLSRSSGRG
jgi:hypothetical protein